MTEPPRPYQQDPADRPPPGGIPPDPASPASGGPGSTPGSAPGEASDSRQTSPPPYQPPPPPYSAPPQASWSSDPPGSPGPGWSPGSTGTPGSGPQYGSSQPPPSGYPPTGGYPPPGGYPGYPGQPTGGYPAGPGVPPPGYPTSDDRTWALIAHFGGAAGAFVSWGVLGWVAPLIAMLAKGPQSPAVRAHAVAALNFQLLWAIISLVSLVLGGCLFWLVVPLVLFLVPVVPIILGIVGGIRANEGVLYRYPMSVSMVK